MKWRFQNLRLVLHRPVLLTTALRRSSWHILTADEKVAVGKCRLVAAKTIEDISHECMADLISGWNAVWFCFQACMVPLVSLFSDTSMPEEVEKWKASIELALQFFATAKDWSIAAKRSGDAVTRLYAAYKTHASQLSQSQHVMPVASPSQYQAHTHFAVPGNTNASAMLNTQTVYGQQPGTFGYNPATPTWANITDPTILNNFWDDMMWDTNLPDMLETPFGLSNDYEYGGAGQDSGAGGACWMHGN